MVRPRLFATVLLTTMAAFFAAARWLPAIDTGAASAAAEAGFTNQLLPLLAILLAGAAALAVVRWRDGERSIEIGGSPPTPYWCWHVAAAALLCIVSVNLDPVWSQEGGYFGRRLMLMDAGERPYVDFEYAYGFLVAYLPLLLHRAGLSIGAALQVALSVAVLTGVLALAALTRRWIVAPWPRLGLFWALVACEVFVAPGPSLNYNFTRYALPFAMLGALARSMPAWPPLRCFASTFALSTVVYGVSPEIGCAFSAAGLAWLAVAWVGAPRRNVVATLAGLAASLAALLLFAWPMFATLTAYGQAQVLMPVVACPIMATTIACILACAGAAGAAALSAWRTAASGRPADSAPVEFCGLAALSVALLPAVVGRAWPTITIAYGFAAIVLTVGLLIAGPRRRAGLLLAGAFMAYVGYVALPSVRAEAGRVRSLVRGARTDPGAAAADRRLRELRALTRQFPHPYDPLAVAPATEHAPTDVGYFPGLRAGDVLTAAQLDRKRAELARAPYYVLPTDRLIAAKDAHAGPDRSLAAFASLGLYPLPLGPLTPGRKPAAQFVDDLYAQCRVIAQSGGIEVCAHRAPDAIAGTSAPPAPPAARRS
jgi:hypothetical protein